MKEIIIGVVSGVAAAAILFASQPANAQAATPATAIDSWVSTVNQQLDRAMVGLNTGRAGVVLATFERGADGRATAITIDRANPALSRVAKLTLQRLHDLPALPDGYAGKRVRMQLLIGDSGDTARYNRTLSQMIAAANTHNAQLAQVRPDVEVAAAR